MTVIIDTPAKLAVAIESNVPMFEIRWGDDEEWAPAPAHKVTLASFIRAMHDGNLRLHPNEAQKNNFALMDKGLETTEAKKSEHLSL